MLKNIIFPGGGLKGWAYIGAIRALTELVEYSKIEQVIGTSIGSLFGLCYVLLSLILTMTFTFAATVLAFTHKHTYTLYMPSQTHIYTVHALIH